MLPGRAQRRARAAPAGLADASARCVGRSADGRAAGAEALGRFEWLAEDRIAQSLQQTLRDLDTAYRPWLRGEGGRPRFKRKGAGESFRLPQGRDLPVRKLNRRWAEVRLPKLGWCRFRLTRPIGGEIRYATVTRDALGWHVSFCVALNQRPAQANGRPPVGVDRGVAATVALSTGELRSCPAAGRASGCEGCAAGPGGKRLCAVTVRTISADVRSAISARSISSRN